MQVVTLHCCHVTSAQPGQMVWLMDCKLIKAECVHLQQAHTTIHTTVSECVSDTPWNNHGSTSFISTCACTARSMAYGAPKHNSTNALFGNCMHPPACKAEYCSSDALCCGAKIPSRLLDCVHQAMDINSPDHDACGVEAKQCTTEHNVLARCAPNNTSQASTCFQSAYTWLGSKHLCILGTARTARVTRLHSTSQFSCLA